MIRVPTCTIKNCLIELTFNEFQDITSKCSCHEYLSDFRLRSTWIHRRKHHHHWRQTVIKEDYKPWILTIMFERDYIKTCILVYSASVIIPFKDFAHFGSLSKHFDVKTTSKILAISAILKPSFDLFCVMITFKNSYL